MQEKYYDAVFPSEIRDFAMLFVDLQFDRTVADYVPDVNFFKSEVEMFANVAEDIIFRFEAAPNTDLRAFAVYVLFDLRN